MYNLPVSPKDVQEVLSKHVLADGYDLTFDMERSAGVYLYDAKHERFLLDFFTGFATMPLGYNHPKMADDEAFKKNLLLAALANPSNSELYTVQYAQFLKTFSCIAIPPYLPYAFFIAGGGLAVENALKAAMDWKVQKNFARGYSTERGFQVIHFTQAFHGRTGYTLSLTNTHPDKVKWYARFNWPRIDTPHVRFPWTPEREIDLIARETLAINQIKQAFRAHKDDICAIIIEPIQSEGGDNHLRKEFFEQLRVLANEHECLLIYDEVQTGVGLTGKFWCYEHFGEHARPDIIAFGKKTQVCGILASRRMDEVENNVFNVPSRINSTWGGNLVDMVRFGKILQIMKEDCLIDNARIQGDYLKQELLNLSHKHPSLLAVRGRGLMCAFDLPNASARNQFIHESMKRGVIFLGCGNQTIRFRPALILQKEHIDKALGVADEVLGFLEHDSAVEALA